MPQSPALRWSVPALSVVLMAGCVATTPLADGSRSDAGPGPSARPSPDKTEPPKSGLPSLQLPEFLKNLPTLGSITAAQTPALPAGIPLKALPRGTPPMAVAGRSQRSMQALFQKGKVSGDELVAELKTMRETMRAQRSARAIQSFMGSLESLPAAGGTGGNLSNALADSALKVALELIKQQAVSVSFKALDDHLAEVMDGPDALRAESITLPPAQGLNETQMRRTLIMASLVVASRVTNKMLGQAEKDFQSIEGGYADLLNRREKAAALLFEALGRSAEDRAQLARQLRPDDLDFAVKAAAGLSVRQFSQDLGAQNVALAYLQRSDPAAYAEYKAQADKMLPMARGYLRTVSGGVAFAGMLTLFSQEMVTAVRGKNAAEILTLMPLAYEFALEVPGLVPVAFNAVGEGVKAPFKASRRFRMADEQGKLEDLSTAKDVFAQVQSRGAEPLLKQSLFRRETSGLLHRLYMCSPADTGRLLDTAIPADEREKFAQSYLQSEQPRFSFASLFELPRDQLSARERQLGDDLLRSDHRERTDRLAFADVQRRLSDGGYRAWGDDQLMRLIFANREGEARFASLQLGDVTIKPIATAESVFAYESLVDACRKQLEPPAASPTAPRNPAGSTAPRRPAPPKAPAPPSSPPRPAKPAG